MTENKGLNGSRILVIEDEYLLADEVRCTLAELGAQVLGPLPSVSDARTFINAGSAIDWVLLDINLRGELAFDVADLLQELRIPFAFVTGYDPEALPSRFSAVTRLEKPVRTEQLTHLLRTVVAAKKPADQI